MSLTHKLVLATDLDGTFLEGSYQDKNFFYNKLVNLFDQVLLIYTTGRTVDTVRQFCQSGYLPFPHFVMGDHGTHIVEGANFTPLETLQNEIINIWNKGDPFLKDLLSTEQGIESQLIDTPFRLAYYYDPALLQEKTLKKIQDAGFDVILSCDRFLDIVPKGVNKGTSLLKFLDHMQISHELVITAGDSLNDLSLFQTGLKGIAVSNSEPKLLEEIQTLNNVYKSRFPGILGIIDGLKFYDQFTLFEGLSHTPKE